MPQLDSSVFWGITGIVIGIITSTIFFLLGKKKTVLEYEIDSTQLITKEMASIPNLKVTIDGQSIEGLASTTIRFINSGNQRISRSDFVTNDQLRIIIFGQLYASEVFSDNPNSRPSIKTFDAVEYYVTFDYLKPKQSFSVTLVHSGELRIWGELKTGTLRKH